MGDHCAIRVQREAETRGRVDRDRSKPLTSLCFGVSYGDRESTLVFMCFKEIDSF